MVSIKVILSDTASETIGRYFENYCYCQYGTDMNERALHYSLIRRVLSHIDIFFDSVYIVDEKKYIDIEDVCTVEFSMEDNETEILIKNIYFIS